MGAVERSYAVVESQIETLGEAYSSFSINQTTVAVDQERYEQELAQSDATEIAVYAKVHNESSEVLYLPEGDSLRLPSTTASSVENVESAARDAIQETVEVECDFGGLDAATILGVRDAGDDSRDTIYSLAVFFEAFVADEAVTVDARWQKGLETDRLFA